jgi:hypothetical protein
MHLSISEGHHPATSADASAHGDAVPPRDM